jgi:uncharacterized protein (TIGR03000 family)
MFRTLAVLGALLLFTTVANAQPGRLPLSPGVMPASPFGPGMPFNPAPFSPVGPFSSVPFSPVVPFGSGFFAPNQPNLMLAPVLAPWGYPSAPYFGTGFGYPYGSVVASPPITVNQSVTNVTAPQRSDQAAVLANEFPATLTVQFPGTAEVWLGEKKVEGAAAEERVLTSPVLKAGEKYTFDLKARWKSGGKTYEAKRAVTLNSGDRSRLLIVSGEEVRE